MSQHRLDGETRGGDQGSELVGGALPAVEQDHHRDKAIVPAGTDDAAPDGMVVLEVEDVGSAYLKATAGRG